MRRQTPAYTFTHTGKQVVGESVEVRRYEKRVATEKEMVNKEDK